MPTVRVKENEPFEVAMRRFKRTVEKTDSYRAALPRVLRKADRRTQAQACRRRKAPPQAPAQPDAAAEAVLSLKNKITEDMKAAMRAKDAARLSAVRLLLSGIKQRESTSARSSPTPTSSR